MNQMRVSVLAVALVTTVLALPLAATPAASAPPPRPAQVAACGNIVLDGRNPEEIVRGQPDPYMVLELRADTCQGNMYLRIINKRAVGRTSCGVRWRVILATGERQLLQALGCPAADPPPGIARSLVDGDSTGRYHWGSLTETIGGKTYVACVDEQGQGRCH